MTQSREIDQMLEQWMGLTQIEENLEEQFEREGGKYMDEVGRQQHCPRQGRGLHAGEIGLEQIHLARGRWR